MLQKFFGQKISFDKAENGFRQFGSQRLGSSLSLLRARGPKLQVRRILGESLRSAETLINMRSRSCVFGSLREDRHPWVGSKHAGR